MNSADDGYIAVLHRQIEAMRQCGQFDLWVEMNPGAEDDRVAELENDIQGEAGMEGFHVLGAMRTIFQSANGFLFYWASRTDVDGPGIAKGYSAISGLARIYWPPDGSSLPYDSLYERYTIFDRTDPQQQSHVALRFSRDREEPEFYYYTQQSDTYWRLALDFADYMDLLLQTRAMVGWQEFFVAGDAPPLDRDGAERFIRRLGRLFPDADLARFRRALARRVGGEEST